MKNIKLILFITFVCYILAAKFSYAQEVSIGVYPPIMQVDATPPAQPKADVFVQNLSDKSIDLTLTLKPFASAPSADGQIMLADNFQSFPDPLFANRILILDGDKPVKTISLAPKQGKKLQIKLLIPASEQKGDYYFSVIFGNSPVSQILSNSSTAIGAVAMNVLLSVGPKGPTDGYIKQFTTPFFVNSGPVPFKVEVVNKSDHFVNPTGYILIRNVFGQTIGKVNLLGVNILSNSERYIPDSVQVDPKNADFKKISSILDQSHSPIVLWPEKFLFGPYTATVNINLDPNGPTLVRSTAFFAFPITYLIGLILILIIMVFIILRVRKKIA